MTVATDLATKLAKRRRYFLRIDGVSYVLCQRVAGPDGDDSAIGSGLNCLRVPDTEWGHDLDLKNMTPAPSAMTFEIDDIEDPADA